jgi:peptide deformylase
MWYGANMKKIVQDGDPVLRGIASPVTETQFGTPELAQVIRDMEEALDAEKDGVALAAPQIGISLRIFMVRYDRLQPAPPGSPVPPELGVYINPEFTRASRRREVMDEGCLSVRGTYGKTYRFERATVRARNADGSYFERGGGGILAQVFQHETDHLNGILFIDEALETYDVSQEEVSRAARTGVAPEGHE